MKEQNLNEMIENCYQICDLVEKEDTGINSKLSLKDMLRIEFLKFAVFLADTNGYIDQEELTCIQDILGFQMSASAMKAFKKNEGVTEAFSSVVPTVLKHLVVADAKKTITNDPFKHQKAQILVDTYKLFGQTLISCHNSDNTDETSVQAYTKYIQMLESFLKEYGLFKTSREKMFKCTTSSSHNSIDIDKEENVEQILEELNELIGLAEVKEEVNRMVNLLRVQKLRADRGLKNSSSSKHLVFSGNPGTGKTTVARMLGKIYRNLGVLSQGQLIEVDRSALVSGYIGQTATKTQEVIDKSMGGILFIDEAYTLTMNKGENDFGQEAVDTLLKAMEDCREDFMVIVAGYPKPMEDFLASNPGLKSRFPKFISFSDYTADELLSILMNLCKQQQYHFSQEALDRATEIFTQWTTNKPENFANARDVRNFFEQAVANHASRVVSIANATDEILSCIEKEDLE